MDKKFELTDKTIVFRGRTLYRIKALKDFGDVKKGDLGGFVEKESNLSQEGNCWICDDAKVFDDATVYGNAEIYGNAKIYNNVIIHGNAKVDGNAVIKEEQSIRTGHCTADLSKNLKENIRCQTNLFPQKDYVIAYKMVRKDLTSFYDHNFQYKIGEWAEAKNPNMSAFEGCSSGLHFSNVNYWNTHINSPSTFLMAKIMYDDIIAIKSGKIRCKRAFIIDKYDIEDN